MTASPQSPLALRLRRYRLHHASGYAMAKAVKEAAVLATGAERKRLATNARRQELCALSFRARIVTPRGDASRLDLSNPRSCKQPSCFLCARQKAARMFVKFSEIVAIAHERHPTAPFLMVTLTLRNYPWRDLAQMLDDLAKAEERLFKMPDLKRAILGRITSFEIVCRGTDANPEAGAHIHILAMAHPDYFSREHTYYVSQMRLTQLFREAARVSYPPIVDIRRVRAADGSTDGLSLKRALLELLKYCVKAAEIFTRENTDDGAPHLTANPDIVGVLVKALYRRRMVRTSGSFAKASRIRTKQQKEKPDTI